MKGEAANEETPAAGLWRPWARAVGAALAAWGLAVFVAAPSLHYFERSKIFGMRSGDFLRQCANPLARDLGTPLMAYRIFVPLVAWLIGARLWLALALPYLATLAMLAVVCFVMTVRFGRATGILATLLVATSYAVTWPNCMLGYGDSVAHLLAAVLLLVRRRWLLSILVLAGLLTDERFALELPFVFLWHLSLGQGEGGNLWIRRAWAPIAAAFAGWIVVRHALTVGWIGPGIASIEEYRAIPNADRLLHPSGMGWGLWGCNAFEGFRWAWGLIFAAMAARWMRGFRGQVLLLAAFLLASVASTIVVYDVARSVGFAFLAIPVALAWFVESRPDAARRFGRWVVWLCLLTPSFWFVTGSIIWWRPFPLRLLAFLTGRDPLSWQTYVH